MNPLESFEEDILRNQELIRDHKKSLHILELQAAKFGIAIPLHIAREIEDIRSSISSLESRIDILENTKQQRLKIISEQINVKDKIQDLQRDIERNYIKKLIEDKEHQLEQYKSQASILYELSDNKSSENYLFDKLYDMNNKAKGSFFSGYSSLLTSLAMFTIGPITTMGWDKYKIIKDNISKDVSSIEILIEYIEKEIQELKSYL